MKSRKDIEREIKEFLAREENGGGRYESWLVDQAGGVGGAGGAGDGEALVGRLMIRMGDVSVVRGMVNASCAMADRLQKEVDDAVSRAGRSVQGKALMRLRISDGRTVQVIMDWIVKWRACEEAARGMLKQLLQRDG